MQLRCTTKWCVIRLPARMSTNRASLHTASQRQARRRCQLQRCMSQSNTARAELLESRQPKNHVKTWQAMRLRGSCYSRKTPTGCVFSELKPCRLNPRAPLLQAPHQKQAPGRACLALQCSLPAGPLVRSTSVLALRTTLGCIATLQRTMCRPPHLSGREYSSACS